MPKVERFRNLYVCWHHKKMSWLVMSRAGLRATLERAGEGWWAKPGRKVGLGVVAYFLRPVFLSVCVSGGVLSKPSKDHCLRLVNPPLVTAETIGNP